MSHDTDSDAPILVAVPDEWQSYICELLVQEGFKVLSASSQDETLHLIHSQAISGLIIVSEWALSSDDGKIPGLIEHFKGKIPSVTLIRRGNRDIAEIYHPPFHDFCTIPFSNDELLGLMKRARIAPALD